MSHDVFARGIALRMCLFTALLFACSGGGEDSPPTGSGPPQPTAQAGRFNGPVTAITAVPNGNGDIYVAGEFTTYSNIPVRPVVRIRPNGSVNDSFKLADAVTAPTPAKRIIAIVAADDGSGDLYVGENHDAPVNTPDDRGQVWKVTSTGALASNFTVGTVINFGFGFPGPDSISTDLFTIVPVGDGSGRVYVGGVFDRYNQVQVQNLVRLNTDGAIDLTFVPDQPTLVWNILPAKDGSGDIYIMTYGQTGPSSFAPGQVERRNPGGTLDPAFDSFRPVDGAPDTFTLVEDGSGDLFVTGGFLRAGENPTIPRPGFVRLNPDGSLDATSPRLNPDTNPDPTSPWPQLMFPKFLTKATDGTNNWFAATRVLTNGTETSNQLRRFKSDGALDQTFSPGQAAGQINLVMSAPDATGDVYAAGVFTTYNSVPVGHIVRINRDGTLE